MTNMSATIIESHRPMNNELRLSLFRNDWKNIIAEFCHERVIHHQIYHLQRISQRVPIG